MNLKIYIMLVITENYSPMNSRLRNVLGRTHVHILVRGDPVLTA